MKSFKSSAISSLFRAFSVPNANSTSLTKRATVPSSFFATTFSSSSLSCSPFLRPFSIPSCSQIAPSPSTFQKCSHRSFCCCSTPTSNSSTPFHEQQHVEEEESYPPAADLPVGGQDGFGIKNPDMLIMFTCGVCETRSVKGISKQSYTEGVVIVKCFGCNNLHLMADNYGWFGDKTNVEEILAAKGIAVSRVFSQSGLDAMLGEGGLSISAEEVVGKERIQQIAESFEGSEVSFNSKPSS